MGWTRDFFVKSLTIMLSMDNTDACGVVFCSYKRMLFYFVFVKTDVGQMLYYQMFGDLKSVRLTRLERSGHYYTDSKIVDDNAMPEVLSCFRCSSFLVEIG